MLTAIKVFFDWLKKNAALLLGSLAIFLMFACFVSGCCYHKNHRKCPEIITNTVIIHDTLIRNIVDSFPYYIVKTNTIIKRDTIPRIIDTAKILKDYYAYHVYNRKWQDTLIQVSIQDTVTENRFLGNNFNYRILRPQTIINNTQDNSITYNSYLYGGIDLILPNMEYASIDVLYAFSRGYLGFGYIPLQKGVSLKGGVNLFKWQ